VPSPAGRPAAGQRGFTLIEVLVATLILSVGLLGVAAMQVQGLQFERNALNGTRATLLAADLADRIRANPSGADFYALDPDEEAKTPARACADTGTDVVTTPCTPEQMAIYDLWEWRESMADLRSLALPGGRGGVEIADGPPPTHRITIRWREDGQDAAYELTIADG
jgi:type IV pilus assembly protein PilV